MKKVFLILLFPLIPLFSKAGDYPNFSPGFRFNPNLSWLQAESTSNDPNKNATGNGVNFGYSVGIMGDYMVKENFGLAVEARITQFSASYKNSYPYSTPTSSTISIYTSTNNINFQYLEIPLSLKMRTDEFGYSKFYIQAGVVTAILTRARGDSSIVTGNTTRTVSSKSVYSNSTPLDFSLFAGLGIEYTISGTTAIVAGLSYHDGLLDASLNNDVSIKRRFISLDLGIKF